MIRLKKHIYDSIIAHAQKDAPIEACGYLAGLDGLVTQHYELTNVDKSQEHFSFDPKEQFEVMKKSRESGLKLLANYHSHPETPARPSQEDIKLAFDPNILYFIVSLAAEQPDVKAFSIKNGEVEKIEITLE